MPPQTIAIRVQRLEQRMTTLEELPSRMERLELQIVQFRSETRDEFSAVRGEMAAQGASLRREMADQGLAIRQEVADQGATLQTQITELAVQMQVLHEDVISRIAQSQEGWSGPPPRKRRGR
ncbi:hypothetical protein BH18ACI5_BH18ACI5_10350 [soil metagenome]